MVVADESFSCEVVIQKQSPQGDGIAFHEGKELYVPLALCGEVVEVKGSAPFVQGSKRYPCQVVRYIKESEQRVAAADYECALYEHCGGCQLMHESYAEQLRGKKAAIMEAMRTVESDCGKELDLEHAVKDVVACETRPCRFKSTRYFASTTQGQTAQGQATQGQTVQGQLALGFYSARSHELIAVDQCQLEPVRFAQLSQSLLQCCQELHLAAYDEAAASAAANIAQQAKSKRKQRDAGAGAVNALGANTALAPDGQLRAVLWRQGDGDEILGCLIVSGALPDEVKRALTQWAEREQVSSFSLGYNSKVGNALFTSDLELLHGKAWITKTLLGMQYDVYAQTFLQVNYPVCEQLYQAAIEHCCKPVTVTKGAHGKDKGKGDDLVKASASTSDYDENAVALDLCCGVGTMTLALARHFPQVLGVELVPEAVAAAQENARNNGMKQAQFVAGDLKKVLPKLLKEQKAQGKHVQAVIADPSRAGLGAAVKALAKVTRPCRLSLIFCALPALQRDLPELLRQGFKLESVQGFDMFPHSSHVETLVLLAK